MGATCTLIPNNLGIQAKFITKNRTVSNPTYKTKTKLMVHSTATPGAPAENFYNSWNSASKSVSVEFFVDDEKILQYMPVGKNGIKCLKSWHCGSSGNNTHIATEVCEPTETQLITINYQTQSRNATYKRTYTIKRIQMELKHRGFYTGEIDGSFGPATETAVKNFQKSVGITQDGAVGKTTLAKLQNRSGSYCAYDVAGGTPFFNKAYNNTVHLFALLCNYTGAKPAEIVCHQEGYKKGIASNHADVLHWWPLHGKSMDDFRNDVAKCIAGTYMDLGDAAKPVVSEYDKNVDKVVAAGIINTPDYWYQVDDKSGFVMNNNFVMALLRQAGRYFAMKNHCYAVDALAPYIGITVPDHWKNGTVFSTEYTMLLYRMVAAKVEDKTVDEISYDDALDICVHHAIINTPDYWRELPTSGVSPSAGAVRAFLRQSAAYFCTQSYQFACDVLVPAIGMNSADYWKAGAYSATNVQFLMAAIAKALG